MQSKDALPPRIAPPALGQRWSCRLLPQIYGARRRLQETYAADPFLSDITGSPIKILGCRNLFKGASSPFVIAVEELVDKVPVPPIATTVAPFAVGDREEELLYFLSYSRLACILEGGHGCKYLVPLVRYRHRSSLCLINALHLDPNLRRFNYAAGRALVKQKISLSNWWLLPAGLWQIPDVLFVQMLGPAEGSLGVCHRWKRLDPWERMAFCH